MNLIKALVFLTFCLSLTLVSNAKTKKIPSSTVAEYKLMEKSLIAFLQKQDSVQEGSDQAIQLADAISDDQNMVYFYLRRQIHSGKKNQEFYRLMYGDKDFMSSHSLQRTMDYQHIKVVGNMGFVAANSELKITKKDGTLVLHEPTRRTSVYEFVKGQWKLVHAHSSHQSTVGQQPVCPIRKGLEKWSDMPGTCNTPKTASSK